MPVDRHGVPHRKEHRPAALSLFILAKEKKSGALRLTSKKGKEKDVLVKDNIIKVVCTAKAKGGKLTCMSTLGCSLRGPVICCSPAHTSSSTPTHPKLQPLKCLLMGFPGAMSSFLQYRSSGHRTQRAFLSSSQTVKRAVTLVSEHRR